MASLKECSAASTLSEQTSDSPPVIRVDSHTHILPSRLANKIRTFFYGLSLDGTRSEESCCSSSLSSSDFAYSPDPALLLVELESELRPGSASDEPCILWTLPYVTGPGKSRGLNKAIHHLAKELNSRPRATLQVIPGCTVHPADGEGGGSNNPLPEEILAEAVRDGARVIKMHVSVGEHSILDTRLSRFFRLAEALRMPVVCHAGTSISGLTEKDEVDEIGTLARTYPLLPVILAHAGHPSVQQALDLTRLHPNLYLDTTPVVGAAVDLPPSEPLSRAIRVSNSQQLLLLAHTGRILFGSDAPTTTMRRTTLADNVRRWTRNTAAIVMGGLNIEDVPTEMERVARRAEEAVLGGAAVALLEGVRSLDEALATIHENERKRASKL